MPGLDLELPLPTIPVVARLRPMQAPAAQMGGPAPFVPQSNRGERAMDKGEDALNKGLSNLLDNAFDEVTRQKRRGDIAGLKERADVSEANLSEGLPQIQAKAARGRGDLDIRDTKAQGDLSIPERRAETLSSQLSAQGASAVASEQRSIQDSADTQKLGDLPAKVEAARLRYAQAELEAKQAELDYANDPQNRKKAQDAKAKRAELELQREDLKNQLLESDIEERRRDLSPEGQAALRDAKAAQTQSARKPLASTDAKDALQARASALTGARLISLLGSPDFQAKLESYTGPVDARTADLFNKDPQVIEFQQLIAQARDQRLHEMSGAAISADEMKRLLQGLVDYTDRDPEFLLDAKEFAAKLFNQGVMSYENHTLNPSVNPLPATVEGLVDADLADRIRARSLRPGDEYTGADGKRHKLTKETVRGITSRSHSWTAKEPVAGTTSAAAPSRPSATPASVQKDLDLRFNSLLDGTTLPQDYPPGAAEVLNELIRDPEGRPLPQLPGYRIRFDEKLRRLIVAPDRNP